MSIDISFLLNSYCIIHLLWDLFCHLYFLFFVSVPDIVFFFFFFQAEDGIRDLIVTGVQTCALPISFSIGKRLSARYGFGAISGQFPTVFADRRRWIESARCRRRPSARRRNSRKIGRASCRERV